MNRTRNFLSPGRSVAVAENGMAATSHPAATLAALDILRAGGNAIDAAIAAVALQGVVDPHMTGIGGDCFVLFAPRGRKPLVALNGSGRAPAAAHLDWFLERGITALPDHSPHAVTVPGAVDAWCRLSSDHGRKSIDEVLQPAIKAAEGGFVIHPRVSHDWARFSERVGRYAGASVYLPGGEVPKVGQRLTLPALARTLKRIGREGRDAFYKGAIADDMVKTLRDLGGLHTLDDFAAQTCDYVEPISANYRGYTLHECPPNGQGLAALIIARILEGFDLGASNLSEADRIHLMAEATKAAYRKRDLLVADPAFAPFDVSEVLSDSAIGAMRKPISLDKALPPETWDGPVHRDTVYVTVVDRDRNAVSFINSLFNAFGSGIYAAESGVLLQNRGSGFRFTKGHANAIAPRKRPLHTIIPGLVTKGDRAVMSFGVMGGQFQSTGHAQILSNIVDRGDNPQSASDRPRSFIVDGALSIEPTIDAAIADDLAKRGHRVVRAEAPHGGCQAIWIDEENGVLLGGSDHRKDGLALGY
ncbi:gamma-glutamyltransferase [Terrirubrum flagellatum]|uniref:gamma-glutamyltransferase n=1 Tax=Terrirubrum flagellatum TaxID=2895980 RepID=UPI003CC82C96